MGLTALLTLEARCAMEFNILKNPSALATFEPMNLGSNGQHANHYITENYICVLACTYSCWCHMKVLRYTVCCRILFWLIYIQLLQGSGVLWLFLIVTIQSIKDGIVALNMKRNYVYILFVSTNILSYFCGSYYFHGIFYCSIQISYIKVVLCICGRICPCYSVCPIQNWEHNELYTSSS
jgi:hypothetical protein